MQDATMTTTNIGGLSHPLFLRRVLILDAATCLVAGVGMTAGAATTAQITRLPVPLLSAVGACLFPIALFIAWIATRNAIPVVGTWLVIFGNLGWVLGSLALLTGVVTFNALGAALVSAQALAVAVLAALEYAGVRRL